MLSSLGIVLPAYNEQARLGPVVDGKAEIPLYADVNIRDWAGTPGPLVREKGTTHMLFTQTARRRSIEIDGDDPGSRGRWVQQFKFLRLSKSIDYEPIAMALKGLQIHYKPGTFLTSPQLRTRPELGELAGELVKWGKHAEPISKSVIDAFLSAIHDGLMLEFRRKPAHDTHYISHCLGRLRASLERYNALFETKQA